MSNFTEKMDVLGLLIDLNTEHLKKFDKLITQLEKTQAVRVVNRKVEK